ncbi:hypothetical protein IAT38_000214 [Cryptococcus sp. DSM 104549]
MSNSASSATSASTSSFVTSLVVNTALAGGELVAFILCRKYIKAIYEPRTYIPPKAAQAPPLGRHVLKSVWQILSADPKEILEKNGVDPYVFVRFLIMMSKAMIPIWLLSWVILLPVDAVKSTVSNKEGLDEFTFGNVAKNKQSRYWAHLIMDYVFVFWILFLIWKEMQHWLVIRQKHLVSPSHSKLAQANTVLVTGIPKHYLDERKLEQLFSHLPGGVNRIWLNRNLKEMPNLYDRRMHAVKKLESAQVDLIKFARKYKLSREKKVDRLEKKAKPVPESLQGPVNPQMLGKAKTSPTPNTTTDTSATPASGLAPPAPQRTPSAQAVIDAENGQAWSEGMFATPEELGRADQLVPRNKRPRYRVKPNWSPIGLGLLGIGQKVDTIEWARKEIAFCTAELEKSRERLLNDVRSKGVEKDYYPPLNSAFIHFKQQIAAHMAAQCLAHNQPYMMNARYTEQSPQNVIWRNLSMNQYEKNVRTALSWAATIGLIILWATPVAFIGVLSNVTTLTEKFSWLAWINGDSFGKKILQGVISGVLPPVLLALLMELLPKVLRQLAAFEGIPSWTGVELDLMTRYFIFLVIHTFFVVTLSSGLTSAVQEFADNPGSVATTLASQMPTASTFFITLILTQFTGTMGTLLRVINLVLYYVKIILLGGSPRSVFTTRYKLNTPDWGQKFPGVTVYAVIMIGYCVISPIINGFGAAFFVVATLVYKYLFIWVVDQPPSRDTGGLFFPKAITHLFVGMYVQQVCMAALFFLARNDEGNASAVPQGALMVVLIFCTIAFQYTLIFSYGPLKNSLPLSLAHMSYGMPQEKNHEGSVIGEDYADDEGAPLRINTSKEPLTGRRSSDATRPGSTDGGREGKEVDGERQRMEEMERAQQEEIDRERLAGEGKAGMGTPRVTKKPAVQDYAYAPNGDDVELGVGATGPGGSPTSQPTPSAATAPGPPASRPASPETTQDAEENVYFAVPGGPGVITRGKDDGNDPYAFFHPATKDPQRIIWLPQDELGLCNAEMEVNEREGVKTSSKGAWLNEKGKVQISGPPPDDL